MRYFYFRYTIPCKYTLTGSGVISANTNSFPLTDAIHLVRKEHKEGIVFIDFWAEIDEVEFDRYHDEILNVTPSPIKDNKPTISFKVVKGGKD